MNIAPWKKRKRKVHSDMFKPTNARECLLPRWLSGHPPARPPACRKTYKAFFFLPVLKNVLTKRDMCKCVVYSGIIENCVLERRARAGTKGNRKGERAKKKKKKGEWGDR